MKGAMEPVTYTIDAAGRTLGRVASEAAHALLGKRSAHFVTHRVLPVTVIVTNAAKLYLPARRTEGKIYTRYTGHPGGLRMLSMKEFIAKKGVAEALRKTIDGMLPRNKLRAPRMKRLVVRD